MIVFGTIRALTVLAALGLVAWLTWRRQWLLLGRLLLAGVLAAGLLALVDRLRRDLTTPAMVVSGTGRRTGAGRR